jgi:hypothetical protein
MSEFTTYENSGYIRNKTQKQTLIVESKMTTSDNSFSIDLYEPLIIDKYSDIYLDSFTTFNAVRNNSVQTSGFVLKINEFNIKSNIASASSKDNTGDNIHRSKKVTSIFIPNSANSATTEQTFTHKIKKFNYVTDEYPQTISKISGTLTNSGTDASPPVYGTAFHGTGRFIAEFLIISRD